MLSGDVSRMQKDGKENHSAGKDRGRCIQKGLFEPPLKNDEMGKDISVQWHSRRKK